MAVLGWPSGHWRSQLPWSEGRSHVSPWLLSGACSIPRQAGLAGGTEQGTWGGGDTCSPCPVSLPDLFVGQLKSCLKCQACGYRSTTFEVFCDLSLPIPKVGAVGAGSVHPGWGARGETHCLLCSSSSPLWQLDAWVAGEPAVGETSSQPLPFCPRRHPSPSPFPSPSAGAQSTPTLASPAPGCLSAPRPRAPGGPQPPGRSGPSPLGGAVLAP